MENPFRIKYRRSILIPLIIVINGVVFYKWQSAPADDLNSYMAQNFLVSWEALQQGRGWVLLTSAFSHLHFFHFFINMYVLLGFGSFLEKTLGRLRFLVFYLIAGVVGSLAHAMVSAFYLGDPSLPALGASGALAGVILVFSLLFPREKILIMGIIPVPAIFGAALFIGLDIWGLVAQSEGGGLPIGHGAHLGGSFTGIIYYLLFLRPTISRYRRQILVG
ncbi:MAG: rhomboid family intramembrane serine protease [Bdellovibrionaceae bacterium]|nr:rhomboid family intramembrane serine protease [Bdellovibrionales bacterium]MCB9085145.1 rhomboid family intramembrane serine protease [Pseudobdellovibrionaceae bacterium]